MGLEKRTVKIIAIVVVTLLVIGGLIGLLLGLLLHQRYVELEVWPRSDEYNWEQPVIQFRKHDPGSWQPWVNRINHMLKAYETTVPENPSRAPCSPYSPTEQRPSPNCEQSLRQWVPCIAEYNYGYSYGTPCIFLRLAHIHYWVPEPYNYSMSRPMAMPADMPKYLKESMRMNPVHEFGDHVWVTCDGEFSADQENIGPIRYIPLPGFPTSRLHTADKLTRTARDLPDQNSGPLVAIVFENPRPGVLINVECRIWTRDIIYDHSSRTGRARFEIFME